MRKSIVISTGLLCMLATVAVPAFTAFSSTRGKSILLVYKPPLRGAPAGGGRIAAAVRGKGADTPTLIALAPNDLGAVSRQQPVIYWYISRPATCSVKFTLNDETRQETVVEAKLPSPGKAGTYPIRLSDYNAKLSPGVVYKWFITLEVDPSQPSKDVYSGGNITYTKPAPDIAAKLEAAGPGALMAVYAQNGFWYEAFDAALAPGKTSEFGEQRVSLLRQVGFGAADPGKDPAALAGEKKLLQAVGK